MTIALLLTLAATAIALAYQKGVAVEEEKRADAAEAAVADLHAALDAEIHARAEDKQAAADLAGVLIKRIAEQAARLRTLETPASVASRLDALGEAVEK